MKFQELINTGFPERIAAKRKRINHLLTILDDPNVELSLDQESYRRLINQTTNSNSVKINDNQLFGIQETQNGINHSKEKELELADDYLIEEEEQDENESAMIWETGEVVENKKEEISNLPVIVHTEPEIPQNEEVDSPIVWERAEEVIEAEELEEEKEEVQFVTQEVVEEEKVEIPATEEIAKHVRTHEEILAKNTNYVFIFGYTGSGKSTVLTAINMYMRRHYRVILNQAENKDGIRLVHEMMRSLENGNFPQPTSVGKITEYDSAFAVNGEDVNLTFLEMAGEDLKRVDVEDGEEGFPDEVKAYLTCPGISISFLIVADYERVVNRTEDRLILQFLSYLYSEGIDLSRVGVILSKFDRDKTDKNIEEVIKEYLPQVDKWLTSDEISHPKVFPFSIGEVESFLDQKDQISRINLDDCSELVPWMHEVLSLPSNNSTKNGAKNGVAQKIGKLFGWKS